MATIAKFYLLDATSPNTGTMPSNSPAVIGGGVLGAGTEATGATTARDTSDVAGVANPDTESLITSAATTSAQRLGHRRFVSRPLAAQNMPTSPGWTLSAAASESSTNHNGSIQCCIYAWRPSTGAQVGTTIVAAADIMALGLTATAETAYSNGPTNTGVSQLIQNGDILVFDLYDNFTQGMATAYTSSFAYDGTTEASTTTCASFITPPNALTLYTAPTPVPDVTVARIRT